MPGPARDPEQFLAGVVKRADGCWMWTKQRMANGYGICHRRGMGEVLAHRVSYRLFVGSIPVGMTIDHLCRNRICVNPAHLEVVSLAENIQRGPAATRGTCKRGHPYDAKNLHRNATTGRRACRKCRADLARARYHA